MAKFIFNTLGDTEREQSIVRFIIVSIVTIYFWLQPHSLLTISPQTVALSYLILSLFLLLWICIRPNQHEIRKVIFTILDQGMIAYAVSFGGFTVTILAVSFWVIIGSAFRFGLYYLYLSGSTAVIGILYNIYLNPRWAGSSNWGWGFLISFLIVVFYTDFFLRRNNEAKSKLINLARIDTLTGLPNRLSLVERLTHCIAMAKRTGVPVSLLFFDIDGFKTVNDTLGHERGDILLLEVARQIKSRFRDTDMLARLGGDEFIIILENSSHHQEAVTFAETVLRTIREIKIEGIQLSTNRKVELKVSASIGITTYSSAFTHHSPTVEEFINQADKAMYAAKKAGKGCYRLWNPNNQEILL